jgi:hypothetical protein
VDNSLEVNGRLDAARRKRLIVRPAVCEKNERLIELTDESVCPTVLLNALQARGVGAFACQPIFNSF